MVRRSKKPYSRSHVSSRKVRDATFGTHVQRTRQKKSSGAPTYSNSKTKRAQRGMVDQVMPRTSTRETRSEYSKRTSRATFTEDIKRKRTLRTVMVAFAVVLVACGAVALIGSTVFLGSASSRMDIADKSVTSALVSPEAGEPYYVLVAGEYAESGQEYLGPSMLMLVRIDEENKQVSMVNIPGNTYYLLSDRTYHGIAEAQILGGDAYLIETVATFAQVPISHYAKVDHEGLVQLVDELGGVEVLVKEEIDDPEAGTAYIAPGQQLLTGQEALTFCRAKNFTRDIEQRADNQATFLVALGDRVLKSNWFGRAFALEAFAGHIKTDYSAQDIITLADTLKGLNTLDIEVAQVPGSVSTDANRGQDYFYYETESWTALIKALEEGSSFESLDPIVEVDPESFTITLRNGSGLTGGAQKIAELMEPLGYRIEETGNADSYVYEETLVIYDDPAHRQAALTVVGDLGIGRAVSSNGFYTFDTDVLVVVGKDWKPLD